MTSWRLYSLMALPCLGLLAPVAARADDPLLFEHISAPAGAALHALPDTTSMSILLSLPFSDPAGAQRFAAAVSDPHNALYGKYLTPAAFGARFGGDAKNYEFLRNWGQAHGFIVGERTDSRVTLTLTGTAGQFARLFHTSFAAFHTDEHGDGRIMTSAPAMPAELAGKISGVVGLSSIGNFAPFAKLRPAGSPIDVGTGKAGAYSPSDIRTAYNIPAQTSGSKTETVGLFEEAGYKASDITKFNTQYKLPTIPITVRAVDGSSTKSSSGVEPEVALDIDTVTGMNPSLAGIFLYVDAKDSFSVQLVDAFELMAQDDVAQTISVSYGVDEVTQGVPGIQAENQALTQLVSQGQTVFVSAGDDGAAGRTGKNGAVNASDPASQPLVTAVGGTTLETKTAGGPWLSETVWNDLSSGNGATGGGISTVWSIPSWQVVNGVSVAVANGGSSTMRNEPDIAADADPKTGYSVYIGAFPYDGWTAVGGTSLSSPLWAGMTTIIDSDRVANSLPRVGFFDPELYQLGPIGTGFHDITVGNNGTPGYTAGPGYDNVSGWGSINLGALLPSFGVK